MANLARSPPPSAARLDQGKYFSPPPPHSMTPPPSTQVPQRLPSLSPPPTLADAQAAPGRTPTPTSLLSSPPPTVPQLRKQDSAAEPAYELPSPEQVSSASAGDLRSMLQTSVSELQKLRTSAAHYKLQHTLLSIEMDEAVKRMAVEHEMTRREVEVLQVADQAQRQRHQQSSYSPSPTPAQRQESSSQAQLAAELKQHCAVLQAENDQLRRRLRRAKKVIVQKDGDVTSLQEDNQRLRKRIKENREHVNRLRRPGGLYDTATPRQADTVPATPQHDPPKHPGGSRSGQVASTRTDREDTFAALLLADQVLSQETNSVPSTPTRARPPKPSHLGHSRGSHSMSSLQPMPRPSHPLTSSSSTLLSPVVFSSPGVSAARSTQIVEQGRQQQRRRESRDSTISASEGEGEGTPRARYQDETEEDEVVAESQASQMATALLRRASAASAASARANPAGKTSGLLQTKLFGRVSKPGLDKPGTAKAHLGKRKGAPEDEAGHGESLERKSRRNRTGGDVGLGIGY
ncbi:MAG: hypothetical protein M1832_004329 [Thelocarpon impressellum]|nr:MAG: hypothetical protein M1832_004329 [Thelocarpon impressellum]